MPRRVNANQITSNHSSTRIIMADQTEDQPAQAVSSDIYGFIQRARPTLDLDELCQPTMITLKEANRHEESDGERFEFQVIGEVLCANSAYFKAALLGEFVESKEKCMTIEDLPSWVVPCFINWLYTRKISLAGHAHPNVSGLHLGVSTRWKWRCLAELYVFCNQYDTKGLRDQVLEIFQIRLL